MFPASGSFEASDSLRKGMRIVVCDQDPAVRARVRAAIADEQGFVLAGDSQAWTECEFLLERFVPELLIARVTQLPPQFMERLPEATFPVLVGVVGEADNRTTPTGLFGDIPAPPDT